MARIAYYRCSTLDQSIEAQRHALGGKFDREFSDEGVSGAIPASKRPGFAELLDYVREGDQLYLYAVDRLGRDAIDIQTTVRKLLDRGVTIEVRGLGQIARGVGEIVLAVLAQVADVERARIRERTEAGREAARAALAATGLTHRGKKSLGRTRKLEPETVAAWRKDNDASIAETAKHFAISPATVKRYVAA